MNKKIKDIQVGDFVKSWDFDNKKVVKAEVLKTWKHVNDVQCYRINDKLTVTGSHEVYTKDGYKLTKDLQVGDKLLDSKGKYTKIKSFKLYSAEVPQVHNLTVKVNNYFANGILVHNGSAKAGNWHGKDAPVAASMASLREALASYGEMKNMLDKQFSEQTGEVGEKLDLQFRELAQTSKTSQIKTGVALGQKESALKSGIGKTGLATVGGSKIRELEAEKNAEAGSLDVTTSVDKAVMTSAHEKASLEREKEKEDMSLKSALRGQINASYATNVAADSYWSKNKPGNVFFWGDKTPESMSKTYDSGHRGFHHYCVAPETKVEMWSE